MPTVFWQIYVESDTDLNTVGTDWGHSLDIESEPDSWGSKLDASPISDLGLCSLKRKAAEQAADRS